jgi:hypothetical protein
MTSDTQLSAAEMPATRSPLGMEGNREGLTVEAAILRTVAYADVFDYPLTTPEIHRYLEVAAPLDAVQATLENGRLIPRRLIHRQGCFSLPGRESIVGLRQHRAAVAAHVWPRAARYSQAIASLPFVRMVALTGALTMDNVEPGDDIDYLIVTEPGRLWLCRALVVALVKLAARQGHELCPNYLLSENALVFHEHNLFTAHEVTQMVPLVGSQTYRRLRQLNAWTADFLPNAHDMPRQVDTVPQSRHPVRALAEGVLSTAVGARLERWEMTRKVRKFSQRHGQEGNASFSPDRCKGHFDSHGQAILAAFADRLRQVQESEIT